MRRSDAHQLETCWRCGGRLRSYAAGEYVQCARCGRAEWRPQLKRPARPDPDEAARAELRGGA